MLKKSKVRFTDFLDYFPEVPLPVTLTEESHHAFSQNNEALSAVMIEQFIQHIEPQAPDEYTEYIPCFRIPETHGFHAIVYFKAALMTYEYVLLTFDEKGISIDKRVIAGTKMIEDKLQRTVATIDDDWIIYCVRGAAPAHNPQYDPSLSKSIHYELLATGEIIISK